MTRRQAVLAGSASALTAFAADAPKAIPLEVIQAHDKGVDSLLQRQITDPKHKYCGAIPDATGLYYPGTSSGVAEALAAAFVTKGSKHFQNALLVERTRLAVDFVMRGLSPEGNIYLPITNFNSPPDTAFFTNNIASAAHIAKTYNAPAITRILEPLIARNTEALLQGGVHTPNHRWVMCSAMAQLHALKPDPRLVRRIDQWLAEGIDINEDGQYSEQSVGGYSNICDRSFVIIADKLKRPELLDPVRRNLNSLLYLLHPNNDVVTEVSVRQDRNTKVSAGIYWFALKYLAVADKNGQFESIIRETNAKPGLGALLEYPQLLTEVAPAPIPADYEKQFRSLGITRIRRGATSATLHHRGNDRFFSFRRGDVAVQAVRFATAFFGKAQFVPERMEPKDGGYYLEQNLDGPYYQPLDKPGAPIIDHDQWTDSRKSRKRTEICRLKQSVFLREEPKGFSLRVQASGTDEVPLAIEISLAPGGALTGAEKLRDDVHTLGRDAFATYRAGNDGFKFGPGHKENSYVDVRGALPRIDGTTVYLTGTTPFDHTLRFEWL